MVGKLQEDSQGPVEGRQQVDNTVAVEGTVAWDTQPLLGHRQEGSLSSLPLPLELQSVWGNKKSL